MQESQPTTAVHKWWRYARGSVVVLLFATACSSPGNPDVRGSSIPGEQSSGSPSPSTSIEQSAAAEAADSSVSLAPDEVMREYRSHLAGLARDLGLDPPPKVALVRFITPIELGPTMVACLMDEGIPAKLVAGGYELGDIPASQATAADLAQYTCSAKYPIHPQYELPLSSAALAKQYEYLANTQVPCMRKLGYSFDDLPTKDVWISSYRSGEVWTPDDDVLQATGGSHEAVRKARKACPDAKIDSIIEHPPTVPR